MSFGKKIKLLMIDNNINGTKLANILGVTKTAISYWVNDKALPSIETAVKLSEIFNVSLDYLLSKVKNDKHNFKQISKFEIKKKLEVIVYHNNPLSANDLLEIHTQLAKHIKNSN